MHFLDHAFCTSYIFHPSKWQIASIFYFLNCAYFCGLSQDLSDWYKNTYWFCSPFRECIRGIGEDLLIQAYNIIDTHQEDFVEVSHAYSVVTFKFEQNPKL